MANVKDEHKINNSLIKTVYSHNFNTLIKNKQLTLKKLKLDLL